MDINQLEKIYKKMNSPKVNAFGCGKEALFESERGEIFRGWIGVGKVVMDLGCRNCNITKWFCEGNKVLGVDIDRESMRQCPATIKTEQIDLNSDWQIGRERKFDVVVSTEVVEHLYHPLEVVKKVSEVLNEGGIFIGTVPNVFNLKNRVRLFFANTKDTPLNEPTHINHFSFKSLKELLESQFDEVVILPIAQKKWKWFARMFPGLGSFMLAFKAKKAKVQKQL